MKNLHVLKLSGDPVLGPGLSEVPNLTDLDLSDTRITDKGLDNLYRLTALEKLDLSGTPITDAGLDRLKGLTKLRELYLARTKVTDAGVEALHKTLPAIKITR